MRIIIIGKGNGWQQAPMEGETWGVNDLPLRRPVKLIFELHDLSDKLFSTNTLIHAITALVNEKKIPILMHQHWDHIPTSIEYPLDEIVEKYQSDYFANSIAYMIAYAMHIRATAIDIYGVNMGLESEYMHEKGSIEFWIGMAVGLGVEVNVHGSESMLLRVRGTGTPQDHLYGYNTPQASITRRT